MHLKRYAKVFITIILVYIDKKPINICIKHPWQVCSPFCFLYISTNLSNIIESKLHCSAGRIVSVTGSTGLLAPPGQSAFSMSQFSLEALCDSLRVEVSPFDVNVITVRPGNYFGATGILNRAGVRCIIYFI